MTDAEWLREEGARLRDLNEAERRRDAHATAEQRALRERRAQRLDAIADRLDALEATDGE